MLLGLVYVGGRRGDDEYRLTPSRPTRVAGGLAGVMLAAVTFWTIWLIVRDRLRDALGWS